MMAATQSTTSTHPEGTPVAVAAPPTPRSADGGALLALYVLVLVVAPVCCKGPLPQARKPAGSVKAVPCRRING
jgi:hypothetical protein